MFLPSRTLVNFMMLSLVALVAASCASEPGSPTAPSPVAGGLTINGTVKEYWITVADEAPAPAPPGPGGNTGNWPPGPPPTAAPGVPVPTPPAPYHRITLFIEPEPVLYNGKPITDAPGCRDLPHTWYYDQRLHNETEVPVTFTDRENFFDGRFTSKNTEKIVIGKYDTVLLHTRWCSGYPTFHYAQTRFNGQDDLGEKIVLSGPWVRLYAQGTN